MLNPIIAPDSSSDHPMPIISTINQLSAPVGVTLQRFIANESEQSVYPQARKNTSIRCFHYLLKRSLKATRRDFLYGGNSFSKNLPRLAFPPAKLLSRLQQD